MLTRQLDLNLDSEHLENIRNQLVDEIRSFGSVGDCLNDQFTTPLSNDRSLHCHISLSKLRSTPQMLRIRRIAILDSGGKQVWDFDFSSGEAKSWWVTPSTSGNSVRRYSGRRRWVAFVGIMGVAVLGAFVEYGIGVGVMPLIEGVLRLNG